MKILPASRSEGLGLLLVPFKVFVPVGFIVVVLYRAMVGYRMDSGEVAPIVLTGYLVSFVVLVTGAMVQRHTASRKAYLWTCAFAASVFVFGLLLLPYLGHG